MNSTLKSKPRRNKWLKSWTDRLWPYRPRFREVLISMKLASTLSWPTRKTRKTSIEPPYLSSAIVRSCCTIRCHIASPRKISWARRSKRGRKASKRWWMTTLLSQTLSISLSKTWCSSKILDFLRITKFSNKRGLNVSNQTSKKLWNTKRKYKFY